MQDLRELKAMYEGIGYYSLLMVFGPISSLFYCILPLACIWFEFCICGPSGEKEPHGNCKTFCYWQVSCELVLSDNST